MTDYSAFTETIKDYNPFTLANMAGCSSPDSADSAGAAMLERVLSDFIESVEFYGADNADMTPEELVNFMLDRDADHEAADNAPSVYTWTLWQEFLDLAAWQEDANEYGNGDSSDMTASAGIALYTIARRLWDALAEELAAWQPEESDDDDAAEA